MLVYLWKDCTCGCCVSVHELCVCDTELVPLFPNKSSLCSAHGRMKRSLFSNCRAAYRSQISSSCELMWLSKWRLQTHFALSHRSRGSSSTLWRTGKICFIKLSGSIFHSIFLHNLSVWVPKILSAVNSFISLNNHRFHVSSHIVISAKTLALKTNSAWLIEHDISHLKVAVQYLYSSKDDGATHRLLFRSVTAVCNSLIHSMMTSS